MGNENTVFTSSVRTANKLRPAIPVMCIHHRYCFHKQKLFIDARDGRIDSVRKGLKAADVDINAVDPEVVCIFIVVAKWLVFDRPLLTYRREELHCV